MNLQSLKILPFFLIILLNNCSAPVSAFLGPSVTALKTGSVYQASISYGSGKIFNIAKIAINDQSKKNLTPKLTNGKKKLFSDYTTIKIAKLIPLTTYAIEISEVIEPEPLP